MKAKPKSPPIVSVGTLNELHWLSQQVTLLCGPRFFFFADQAEKMGSLWGRKVQVILNAETNYLQQIEAVECDKKEREK